MRDLRPFLGLITLLALLGQALPTADPALAAGVWLPTGALHWNRNFHAATLLRDGRVLIIGGERGEILNSTERYDPATGNWTFVAGAMRFGRIDHTATTLTAGRVLVTGGSAVVKADGPVPSAAIVASTEVYDPASDKWSPGAPLGTARAGHSATLLGDGRLLVVGGMTPAGSAAATAELFDPRTNTWSATNTLPSSHAFHLAVRLASGEVLVIGGRTSRFVDDVARAEVERYDPATNSWRAARSLPIAAHLFAAVPLADGRVLAVGQNDRAQITLLYDPAADTWTTRGAPSVPIDFTTATLLPSGQVLVTGGRDYASQGELGLAALYDPATDTWTALPNMRTFRFGQTATALRDGRVLIAGGGIDPAAELYVDSDPGEQCFPETGKCLRGRFLAYWLGHGGLAVNGYPLTDQITEKLEDGHTYTVQYLERVRLEYHPENADPRYQVLLGQFGRQIHPAEPPAQPDPAAVYFQQTGHNLGWRPFRAYWDDHGGLEHFGYPLTEVIAEALEDGKEYRVQYFERARFEWHPQNETNYQVLLGQFGRRIMVERGITP